MECTQRLECTQELYVTQNEKLFPEQIGFLGICGNKYPLKKGPNKIGRDPQTCSIILNLNSISRQHAVINILNKKEFMLMDLESANKTKLSGKTLQPYIPQPLQNGDMVQFGDIFGVFRLLEEDDDLPMTQALDIPDTPVPLKHMSRVNAVTTVPESPEVSDRDDSFIVPSQIKGQYQSPKTRKFIKPGRTISIQPIGTNKIDNIYWNSSKKSTSLNLDDSNCSLNDSVPAVKLNNKENEVVNIHELETQEIFKLQKVNNESTDSIYTANTQLPDFDSDEPLGSSVHTANTQMPDPTGSPSIHSLNTQMPCGTSSSIYSLNTQIPGAFNSPSIHNADTQIPLGENLPEVCKINEQQDMQFNLCTNKDSSIYNAETQLFPVEKKNISNPSLNKNGSPLSIKSNNLNTSNEVVLFEELDSQPFEEVCESQAILSEDIDLPINRFVEPVDLPINRLVEPVVDTESQSQMVKPRCSKRNMRIESDSSTDCEDIDILPTQKIPENKPEDDTTDCEEDKIDLKVANKDVLCKTMENFEDLATQVIQLKEAPHNQNKDLAFEDIPTQVLDIDNIEKDAVTEQNLNTDIDFEDLPTQVLEEDMPIKKLSHAPQLSEEKEISPFKVPFNSALKAKNKYVSKTPKIKPIANISKTIPSDDNRYYQDTQDIFNDLCTQRLDEPEMVPSIKNVKSANKVDSKSPGTLSAKSLNKLLLDASFNSIDAEEIVEDYVSNLSSQDVREVIGVDKIKKVPSDGSTASDVELTPKKMRPFKFMDIDLPNSQEIKTSVSYQNRSVLTESSSESETEVNSEDQCTPILFRKKKKPKAEAKLDLTKKFDVEALPTRVITRVRKPTTKIQNQDSKKATENILKPNFMAEQEDEIDKEIITENISRLKSKNEKSKNAKSNHEPSKESKQVDDLKVSIAECVKKENSQKKTKNTDEKLDKPTETTKDTNKDDKRKKREPRKLKDSGDSKNSSSTSKIAKQAQNSIVESKEKTPSNKSKEIGILDLTESPVEIKRATRSTRNKKPDEKPTEKKTTSPKRGTQTEKPKRKYTRKHKLEETKKEENDSSPDKEVRRSKRQRTVKEKKEEPVTKSILKKSIAEPNDQSAVYNLSSGSNSDTSRSFKRPALDESVPSPKRTRSVVANNMSLRGTPARQEKTHYLLFTAFPYEQVKVKLEKIGAVIVTDVMQSTVLLTRQIKRTFKLLCAVGLGKPIVGPDWVQACADTNMIVDPWLYLIKDEAAEKRFHFSLEQTLSGKRGFLKGYNVSSTPKVMPEAHEMKLIVECSGGTWKEGGPQWICVSTPDDMALWPALRARGAVLVTTEFILGGVLRQKVDIEINRFK